MPQRGTVYEVLEELAITVQRHLVDAPLPFCAFNGGSDVFVDVGNKSLGLEALMSHLGYQAHQVTRYMSHHPYLMQVWLWWRQMDHLTCMRFQSTLASGCVTGQWYATRLWFQPYGRADEVPAQNVVMNMSCSSIHGQKCPLHC